MANYVKFLRGTPTAYNNLLHKDPDTLYFIHDASSSTGKLYLGDKLIAGSISDTGVVDYLSELKDVDTAGAKQNSLLGFDAIQQKWIVMSPQELLSIPVMEGATESTNGVEGLVPAPLSTERDYFLRGDGIWAPINISASDTQIFEITLENNQTHIEAINNKVGETELNNGDIAIVKELIADDKYQYTAYVYSNSEWIAMDGNYNAENVYFNDDILVTTKVGTIQTLVNGQATLAAKGKNVKQVLSSLLAERKYPTATKPSATIELTNEIVNYEVGTKVIPTWKITFNSGSYTYGPNTGVTDTGATISSTKDSNISIAAGQLNGATGNFNEYQIADNTKYYAYLTYNYSAGTTTPVDNFGDEYTDTANNLPIQAAIGKTDTSNKYISGYRNWFVGGLNSNSETVLTSELIRQLTPSNAVVSAQTFELKAADYLDCKRIIIAIDNDSDIGVVEALLKSASNADITSEFKLLNSTVEVNGAENYLAKPYKIYQYAPASLDSTEVYTITLG